MTERLEQIRAAIRAENVSYGELAELQDLADQIDPGDFELLQWAGVEEFPEAEDRPLCCEVYGDGCLCPCHEPETVTA